MDNILNIFYEYSINNKLLDKQAITKILDIILKELNFNNKIIYSISKDERFDLSNIWNSNILAEFDFDSIIYIYYLEILKSIHKKKYLTKFDINLNNTEISFKKNILIIETIFHEIEHVKQLEKIKDIYNGSIESELYRYEYDFLYPCLEDESFITYHKDSIKRDIIYLKNYKYSFMERMANLNSSLIIANLLHNLGKDLNNLYNIQNTIMNYYLIKDYDNNLSGPTIKFITNIGYINDFKEQIDTINNMSFEDRLKYGFMITKEEYLKKVKK